MSQKDIIQGMRDIASAVLPAGAEALLFGSRARGDARADSDKYAHPFVSYGWSVGGRSSFIAWRKQRVLW